MSPHAVLGPIPAKTSAELASFGVSDNAFLPSRPPLDALQDPYYQPWERLARQLPTLIKARALRDEVDRLPVLATDRLASMPERRRAYTVLAFLAHGYIWSGLRPAEILPPSISVPFLAVSREVELPPVATYAALNLWNYRIAFPTTASVYDLDGLEAQLTFTGTVSESWFYMVSVAMEAEGGGPMIPAVIHALRAIRTRESDAYAATITALDDVAACVRRLSALLARMHEHCDPVVFYHEIRPFLAGSLGMASAGLPRGVLYDEGDGKGVWRQLRGGSNGQSTLIQFLDLALGVEHAHGSANSPHASSPHMISKQQPPSFQQEVRDYMPGPHRRFLEAVRQMGSLRTFAMQAQHSDDPVLHASQQRCHEAYQVAVDAMTALRNSHLRIVARYIVVPSQQPRLSPTINLASASSQPGRGPDRTTNHTKLTGTGGTTLMPFLRKARDETIEAGCIK